MNNLLIFSYMYGNESWASYSKDAKRLAKFIMTNTKINVDVVTGLCLDSEINCKENIIFISEKHKKLLKLREKREKLINQMKKSNLIKKGIAYLLLRFYNIKYQKILKNQLEGYEVYDFTDKEIKKFVKKTKKKYDAMLCYSTPFTITETAYKIKELLGIEKFFIVVLDPYCDLEISIDKKLDRQKKEKVIFDFSDKIFVPKEIYKNAKLSPIKKYKDKVEFVPDLFIDDKTNYKQISSDSIINFVYSGLFYHDIRNPKNLLELFIKLPENYHLHLYYGFVNGEEDVIKSYKDKLKNRLHLNGFVLNQEEYNKMLGKADFLINIGNKVDTQIPSKIFDYFSFGGPIVNFYQIEGDYVSLTFQDYKLMKNLDYQNIDVLELIEFVNKNKSKKLTYHEIIKHFYEFSLDCFVRKLEKF